MTKIRSLAVTDVRPILWMGLLLSVAFLLSACSGGIRGDKVAFDGINFRSTSSAIEKQRDFFEITVAPASSSITGAREAGRYEATRYCIENFGSSDMNWLQGPDAADGTLTIDNDRLILRGTCTPQ